MHTNIDCALIVMRCTIFVPQSFVECEHSWCLKPAVLVWHTDINLQFEQLAVMLFCACLIQEEWWFVLL